jgi:hypothetical protein
MTATPTTERNRRRAAGLQPVLAWLTASQALTVTAWEAENLAAVAQIVVPDRRRKVRPAQCTCQGGEA